MDLDDWEYLPDAAYLLSHHDDDDDHHRGVVANRPLRSYVYAVNSVFDMDYFSTTESHLSPPAKLFIPGPQFVPFQFRSPTAEAEEVVKRLMEDTVNAKQQQQDKVKDQGQDGAVSATQIFFKSNFLKETNEFVDMKFLDSTSPRSRALIADFRFDEAKTDDVTSIITTTSPRKNNEFDLFNDRKIVKFDDQVVAKNDVNWIGEGIIGDDCVMDDDGGFNLWKLGFGGIGAICSFGVAAATICLLIFGNNHNPKQNHKLMFQIYADDNKRMKQVVDQTTKFNEVMSAAVRGVPLNRAHITYGGYYENAL